MITKRITDYFKQITDPRIDRRKLHLLEDIIGLAIIAVICGCESWESIEDFGKAKKAFLKKILKLPNGIPSHDTIERLFKRINPKEFERCFIMWANSLHKKEENKIINLDGKCLRGSQDRVNGKSAIHLVSAWANENHLVLGQVKVDEKSNEITAIPELLEILDIENSIVTIDAMGCQTSIAEEIIKKNADYVLALKGNQGYLREQVESLFNSFSQQDIAEVIEKSHGRIETRTCSVINNLDLLDEKEKWKNLRSLIKIKSTTIKNGKKTSETRYYISSLLKNSKEFNEIIRKHWGIENSLHWVLDVAFNEDHCRKRKDNAAENFAIARRIAFNLLRQDKYKRFGIQNKRMKAAYDDNYLLKILEF